MARDFDGALPYLQLIADGNGFPDALDPRVVEAYWLGGPELDRVGPEALTSTTQRAFSGRSGPLFPGIEDALAAGALPHHSFAVFCVYPWVAMLGDPRRTPQAMIVLDRCRIRWGRVISIDGDVIIAESQPLTWDGAAAGAWVRRSPSRYAGRSTVSGSPRRWPKATSSPCTGTGSVIASPPRSATCCAASAPDSWN